MVECRRRRNQGSRGNRGENAIKKTTRRSPDCQRPEPLHSRSTDSPGVVNHAGVKYVALACAIAPLCLFAGWAAATSAASGDAAGKVNVNAALAGKSAAYTLGATHDYSGAPASYNGLERYSTWENSNGKSATYQPEGPFTSDNPFFRPLGTNGRACVTCHEPSAGWTITPVRIRARFEANHGADPLFRPFDGATCPDADVSTPAAMKKAYGLLLNKGLIRIGIRIPP